MHSNKVKLMNGKQAHSIAGSLPFVLSFMPNMSGENTFFIFNVAGEKIRFSWSDSQTIVMHLLK